MSSPAGPRRAPRGADWRFLLPSPPGGSYTHLVLLGGSKELQAAVLQSETAAQVTRSVPPDRSADALILLNGAGVSLGEALPCLKAGGVCYAESPRLLTGWRWRAGERTGWFRAGLTITGMYWVRPHFQRPGAYVPLEPPAAAAWYLNTLLSAESFVGRALRAGARVPQVARWTAGLLPYHALTAVRNPSLSGAPGPLGLDELTALLGPPGLRPLLLTPGSGDFDRVVVLPFNKTSREPVGVVKVSRSPERNHDVEHEQVALENIRGTLDRSLQETVPAPLGLHWWGGLRVGCESYLGGRLLASAAAWGSPHGRPRLRNLSDVTAWLIRFHQQATIEHVVWGPAAVERWIDPHLARYRRVLSVSPDQAGLFSEVRRLGADLLGSSVPIVWQHGALAPQNVCRGPEGIGVFDWEAAEVGLPLVDLLYFVLHWSYAATGARDPVSQLQRFKDLFCKPARTGSISVPVHRCLAAYMRGLELPNRLWLIALTLMCVHHAVGRAERPLVSPVSPGDPRAENPYVRYLDLLANQPELPSGRPR